MSIDAIAASRLRIPLVRPYRLAFGAVTHYDTLVVEIVLDDGRSGYGEATLLTGYTDETIEGAWDLAADLVETLCGLSAGDGRLRLNALAPRAPFLASAFSCALDHAGGHPLLRTDDARRVPLLGLLQGDDDSSLRDEFARLLAGGYKTVKVKVGFDARADAHHVAAVQRIVDGRAAIRIDANQGYAAEDAVRFIDSVDPVGIELFEQPCAAGDWDAHAVASDAARRRKLPLMLDESIYGIADIERAAAEHACRFIKLKLMKFAGIDALTAALERIRGLGMQPVLGNGVACDLSCWMEACVASRYVDNAGEMNGFLKVHETLFGAPLPFDNGHVVLPAGYAPQIDRQALAARACGHVRRHRKVHACRPLTLVTGVIGADTHIVGNRILSMALEDAGYRVVALGALTPAGDFIKAAIETAADAILVSSLYGQGELDCRGFRDLCVEAGLEDILLYVGGNLVVGKQPWPDVERRFLDMGFDRAFPPGTRVERALELLASDFAARGKRIGVPETR